MVCTLIWNKGQHLEKKGGIIHVEEIMEVARVLRLIGILRPVRQLPCRQIGAPTFIHQAQNNDWNDRE